MYVNQELSKDRNAAHYGKISLLDLLLIFVYITIIPHLLIYWSNYNCRHSMNEVMIIIYILTLCKRIVQHIKAQIKKTEHKQLEFKIFNIAYLAIVGGVFAWCVYATDYAARESKDIFDFDVCPNYLFFLAFLIYGYGIFTCFILEIIFTPSNLKYTIILRTEEKIRKMQNQQL